MDEIQRNQGDIARADVIARLGPNEAAQYLGVKAGTLATWRCQGRGPRYYRLGSRIFYRAHDLDRFIEAAVVETEQSRASAA